MAEYVQWRNKNSYRSYPVADDSSFTTEGGDRIPDDVFIDALITPIDPDGTVYVSSIDFPNNALKVSDSSGVIAEASLESENTDLVLYDQYGRNVGVIVVAESFYDLGGLLAFEAHAMPFAPAAILPQSQNCVRGLRLPDGTLLTGDVTLVGVDGVEVTYEESTNTIRIDIVGATDGPGCIELPPPLKCFEVEQTGSGGVFSVEVTEDSILLDTAYQLDELCAEKKAQSLPSDGVMPDRRKDPCDEEEVEPCTDPVPVAPKSICGNSIKLVPVSSLIGMEVRSEPGIPAYGGADGLGTLPERKQYVLKLYLRGLYA